MRLPKISIMRSISFSNTKLACALFMWISAMLLTPKIPSAQIFFIAQKNWTAQIWGGGCSPLPAPWAVRPFVPFSRLSTVGNRAFPVAAARRTNMEQFASRSDIIKFPANLQNQTEILIYSWRRFHSFRNCSSVCKVSEVLRHFFTLNVM